VKTPAPLAVAGGSSSHETIMLYHSAYSTAYSTAPDPCIPSKGCHALPGGDKIIKSGAIRPCNMP
jgi:hypothetical protein